MKSAFRILTFFTLVIFVFNHAEAQKAKKTDNSQGHN